MKLKPITIALCSVLLLLCTWAKAQTDSVKYSASHLQAAERVIVASGVQENMQKMFDQIIEMQSKQLPEDKRAAFREVMQKFMKKYVTREEIRNAFVPLYASEFTEDELNKIADFLSSPAGKAMTAKQPELFQKGSAWGIKLAQAHQSELEQMMKDAMDK